MPKAPTLLLDLYVAHHSSGRLVEHAVRDAGITAEDFAVISALGADAHATPTELGERLGLYLTTTVARIRHAEEQGLLRRRPNPDDGRSFVVSLTADGARRRAAAARLLAQALTKLEDELDFPVAEFREELVALGQALRRVADELAASGELRRPSVRA